MDSSEWQYVAFSQSHPCNVGGVAWRRGRELPWRRKTNGKSGATLSGDGELVVHHFTSGSATDCGVDVYNTTTLTELKTNWKPTTHRVTCKRCGG